MTAGHVRRTSISTGVLGAWLALALGCGPVPGGSLSGVVTATPEDWSTTVDARAICEVEARPEDPHSIQLECFLWEGELYVQSHRWALASWWPVESWAAVWIDHPEVRVRIGEQIFELTAARIVDPEQREAVLGFRGYDPVPDGVVLFRFDPRTRIAARNHGWRVQTSSGSV